MSSQPSAGRPDRPVRVGLFGRLASGNIGNDASMEAILGYLSERHPTAIVDAMCNGPERMKAHYGIDATELFHQHTFRRRPPKVVRAAAVAWDKLMDAAKIAAWVRRHDVVIIPGMGILEATLPIDPWGMPYSQYLLSAWGRLLRTKVALISIGAGLVEQRSTRWLFTQSARLAHYLSFRDVQSLDAMARQGLDTSRTAVCPDLAFAIPVPPFEPGQARTVGIGVMHYSGSNSDRGRSAEIRATYVRQVTLFARWLVDSGYRIRLFFGDNDDAVIAEAIVADLAEYSPGMAPETVILESVSTFDDVTRVIQSVSIVVATRFHNLVASVRLAKPTLSLGYGSKSVVIMTDAGLADFCLAARSLDLAQIIERFQELERRSPELRQHMQENAAEKARLLDDQFTLLSAKLFPPSRPQPATITPNTTKAERDTREEPARPGR